MPEETTTTAGTETGAAAGTSAVDTAATTTATTTATAPEKVEDLPAWAQKIITDARSDAAKYRTDGKTAAEKAAQDAEKALTDRLAVALGLKEDAAADPAKLTASLTAAQESAKTAARELAIFKAAAATGADPGRLLDSNAFMSSVTGLEPTDGAAITAAITAAVAANPLLKAVQAASASGTELGGSGETGQITEAQLAQMNPEQIAKALKEGKLKHLL